VVLRQHTSLPSPPLPLSLRDKVATPPPCPIIKYPFLAETISLSVEGRSGRSNLTNVTCCLERCWEKHHKT
jgi:hypothetical protein